MFQLISDFERPPKELVEQFIDIPTSILSDSLGRKGAMDSGIQAIDFNMKFVGPAFTVKAYPADNLMCHLALKLAQPGDIIVVDASGFLNAGLWGELTSLNAKLRRLGGLVIDGAIRDRAAIVQMGFPVFARGCVPTGTFKTNLGSVGVPIACGGINVSPGDLVVGDSDGVAVVPLGVLETVLLDTRTAMEKEAKLRSQIEEGNLLFDLLDLDTHFIDNKMSGPYIHQTKSKDEEI